MDASKLYIDLGCKWGQWNSVWKFKDHKSNHSLWHCPWWCFWGRFKGSELHICHPTIPRSRFPWLVYASGTGGSSKRIHELPTSGEEGQPRQNVLFTNLLRPLEHQSIQGNVLVQRWHGEENGQGSGFWNCPCATRVVKGRIYL